MIRKLYTQQEYIDACKQANTEGKIVKLVQKEVNYMVRIPEYTYEDKYIPVCDESGSIIRKELATEKITKYNEETKTTEEITVTLKEAVPVMIEEETENPITGKKDVALIQKHHTELKTEVVEELQLVTDSTRLDREFFPTSLGYVRRKVTMQNGSQKDFLSDILPLLQVGIQVLTYSITGVQSKVAVTEEFLTECKQQMFKDFYKN